MKNIFYTNIIKISIIHVIININENQIKKYE